MPDSEQPLPNRRLVWALRVACILFLILSPMLTVLALAWTLTALISILLYPIAIWGLRSASPKRYALVIVVALGSSWFVLSAMHAYLFAARFLRSPMAHHSSGDVLLFLTGSMCVLTLLQGGVVGVVLKLRGSIPRGRDLLPKLSVAMVGGVVWGVVIMAIMVGMMKLLRSTQPGQHPAVGSLRTINTAEITYAATYGGSYSPSLAELGVPPEGTPPSASAAGLIDSALASGIKRIRIYDLVDDIVDPVEVSLGRRESEHGYRYDYRPGPRDEQGRINSYKICARPIGERRASFFTDETGVIRETYEDRCPNEKDLPIPG